MTGGLIQLLVKGGAEKDLFDLLQSIHKREIPAEFESYLGGGIVCPFAERKPPETQTCGSDGGFE
jgi:hypothetical protein